ncbi:hypothetical protein D7V86_11465 [bacterium D16-51]|nr:hypothetical protein D7V96_12985 [bacterium D16-59]RKI59787.1 hypothetical protein D7V86_11465 [bacterium D16-51]
MKSKIRTMIAVIIGLVAGYFVCMNFHPENWMKKEEAEVTLSQIEKADGKIYTGRMPAGDVLRLSGKEEFEELYQVDEVTVEPTDIVPTGVGRLSEWADPYMGRAGTRKHKRKREVQQKFLDILGDYNEYYLIQCPDKTYILAQLPDKYVKAIKKGEKVTLPIGRKESMPPQAKSCLEDICKEYDAPVDGVLYTFDNEWYQEHSFMILVLRLGAGAVVLFAGAVILLLLLDKIFGK